VVRVIDADFEDALLICLDVLEASVSLEEAQKRIMYLLNAYREARQVVRVKMIKEQLDIWTF